ncbi:centrosomal protein of 126 kDa [Rana temporaria]|uniref:centrosomal protein of 126 kDa n=1 Tax=Rana temporaria TaxID=8407 RepID=UPI001AACA8F1|nr:centrosomal protein of 126 kDa [Rana temporaria]
MKETLQPTTESLQGTVMQDQRTKSYSHSKTQLEIDWEEERRALQDEQKIIRQRAQKLSVETNRRRKALEDKRREEELKEQRLREEILQQRKIKLQEATEKFQRAHLPPSQRRRTAYVVNKKPNPKLEDALRQIQSTLSSTFYYMSNHRSPTNTRSSDSPSSNSSIGTSAWSKRQESAPKLAFEGVYQDKAFIQFDSDQLYFQNKLQEAQRLLEEQHLNNIQDFHQEVEQLAHSESLSSLDSLEEGLNTNEENDTVQELPIDTLHRALLEISSTVNSGNHYTNRSNSGLNSGKSSPEPNQVVPDILREQNVSMKVEEWHRSAAKQAVIDPTSHNGSSYGSFSPTRDINHFSEMPTAEEKTGYPDMGYRESSTVVVRPSKAWATPDPTPRETTQALMLQNNKDMVQCHGLSIKPIMTQPLATPIVVPLSGSSASNCQPNSDLKQSKHTHEIHLTNSVSDATASSYNSQFYRVKSDLNKPIEGSSQSTPLRAYLSSPNLVSNIKSGVMQEEKEDRKSGHSQDDPDDVLNTFYIKARTGKEGHRLLKSILKKVSKYEKGYNRTLGIEKMFQLGEKSSDGLRDSVELAKEKEKNKNKKLRWLDEKDKIMDNKEAPGTIRNLEANLKSQLEPPASGKFMEHVLVPTVSITDQVGPSTGTPSSVFSTGYHFTKQAWMANKGEEINSVGHTYAIRTPPKAKTRIAKRPKSAKSQSVVAYRNRRGVIIRPQSATEASKIAKTQGKAMVPRPPPRHAMDNTIGEAITETKGQPANISQVNHLNNVVQSPSHGLTRDAMPSKTISRSLGNLIAAQQLGSPDAENATKSLLTLNSDRVSALQESLPVSAKRKPVYGENGLRLDHTPTDEEIALLWKGVRSALSHKNSTAGDFHPGDLPSNLQTRPNLSHVVIDGATLNNWKTFSRANGFSSPFVNGYVTLPRRRQNVDNNENKRKALLEQRKGRPCSAGWRPPLSQNLHTVKISPIHSTQEPAQVHPSSASVEVSESTAQFMLAENLVETSATDGEILAAMQTLQANKQNLRSHKSPNTGHTALSIEEQRLLQSLDRLNQRLQTVQDTMTKPPGTANGFPIKSTLNIFHHIPAQPMENAIQMHKYRSLSADPRTRLQRRY